MAISPQAPLCTDMAYAKTATPSRAFLLPLLGSVLVLTACAATTSSPLSTSTSAKEKTMTTAISTKTEQPKRTMDGSKPFTMPEIEERLWKVLALPPAQIGKENIEKIFGVVLEGEEIPEFFEEISTDKQIVFSVTTPSPWPASSIFKYRMFIKKFSDHNGDEYLEDMPDEIPVAYKFSYPVFAEKLKEVGWKIDGLHREDGDFWGRFWKDGFRLEVYTDTPRRGVDDHLDFNQTHISRIVISAPNNR